MTKTVIETRTMMDNVHLLLENEYEKVTPLKYEYHSYTNGRTYSFSKGDKEEKLNYVVVFNSSPSVRKRTILDPHYKKTISEYETYVKDAPTYLLTFKALFQKGKVNDSAIDEINLTISQIIKSFSLDTTYQPHLIILDPIREERQLDTNLIIKTLAKGWVMKTYLDNNDSSVYLFIKVK